jgi:glucose/arabinose dehydrogenase
VKARFTLLGVLAAVFAACGGGGGSEAGAPPAPGGYRFTEVASGLGPLVHVTAPRGERRRLYVVEQEGRIRILENGRVTGTLLDIRSRVVCCGEQGLLSVAFHPRFARNGRYYVNYTAPANRVVEYRGRRALRTLLNLADPYSNHNGGQNVFGPDGRLYVGTGDAGAGGDPEDRAQNLASRFGKLLAINVDRRGARWQTVGYGLRNPWRFSFDRRTGDLYIGDVGQNAWEEVDFTPRRSRGLENYGWDVYEGRARFESKPRNPRGRLVFPVAVYPLSGGHCAVVGGFVYRGSAAPAAQGRYFYGDNCSGTVWSLRIVRGRARDVRRERFTISSLSSFGEDANGELYAVNLRGTVYRLTAA